MEQRGPAFHVTVRLHSWVPVAVAVLLVLLQLFSPNRAWVILLCGVGGMTLAAYLWARSLARSVRIPARLAVGYAMGHYDSQRGAYVVTEKDGHAWPEIYFPGYGWIAFEPTSGLRPLERMSDAEDLEFSLPVFPSLPERSW
jgi:hypothetical protein